MSKKGSSTVTRLIDHYITAIKQGGSPTIEEIIAQCPAADQEDLRLALIGIQSLLQHHWTTYASTETIDKTLAGMKKIRERKLRLKQASERLAALPERVSGDPIELLLTTLDFPPEFLQIAMASRPAPSTASAWFRGQPEGTLRSQRIVDRAGQTLLEKRMAEQVTDLLERYEVDEAPIDPEPLARRLGLMVRDVALDEEIDGCLLADDHFGAILLNRRIANPQRRRFTLAHEIAHFILHRKWRAFRDHQVDLGVMSDASEEVEANTLASMLLMPSQFIPKSYASDRPSFSAAAELSHRFDVSLQAALRRLVRMSDWECALVVSEDGKIRWWVASNDFDCFIRIGRSPHPSTAAAHLLAQAVNTDGKDVVEGATSLPLSAWVDIEEEDTERVVREESRQFGDRYTYSLITLQ